MAWQLKEQLLPANVHLHLPCDDEPTREKTQHSVYLRSRMNAHIRFPCDTTPEHSAAWWFGLRSVAFDVRLAGRPVLNAKRPARSSAGRNTTDTVS